MFQRAKNSSPCVIFFDEIDALCPKRSQTGDVSIYRVAFKIRLSTWAFLQFFSHMYYKVSRKYALF